MASNGSAELMMMVEEMSGMEREGEQARVPVIRGQRREERGEREKGEPAAYIHPRTPYSNLDQHYFYFTNFEHGICFTHMPRTEDRIEFRKR